MPNSSEAGLSSLENWSPPPEYHVRHLPSFSFTRNCIRHLQLEKKQEPVSSIRASIPDGDLTFIANYNVIMSFTLQLLWLPSYTWHHGSSGEIKEGRKNGKWWVPHRGRRKQWNVTNSSSYGRHRPLLSTTLGQLDLWVCLHILLECVLLLQQTPCSFLYLSHSWNLSCAKMRTCLLLRVELASGQSPRTSGNSSRDAVVLALVDVVDYCVNQGHWLLRLTALMVWLWDYSQTLSLWSVSTAAFPHNNSLSHLLQWVFIF